MNPGNTITRSWVSGMSGALRRNDVAVIGLGAMGSAAALQLARRGARVLGLDRFDPPHALGSSHGDTRVTRLAIGEGDHLTPLAMRSHQLWREIERESGASLLQEIGALIISSDQNAAKTHVEGFFGKTVAAAEKPSTDRKSTRLNSSHVSESRMPSSA